MCNFNLLQPLHHHALTHLQHNVFPQVAGPSDSSGEERRQNQRNPLRMQPSPPPGAFTPRTSHLSLPQPPVPLQSQPSSQDSEAINSYLDDS